MISGFCGIYQLECDICGQEADEEFDEFMDAVIYKKDRSNGWTSRKVDGAWEDVCPDCNPNNTFEDTL
jgi:hypothetical protein